MPLFGGGGGRGGIVLGNPVVKFIFDTSGAASAQVAMRRLGRDTARSLDDGGLKKFSKGIRDLRGELTAAAAIGAGITILGHQSARDLRRYRIQFKALLGDFEQADALIEDMATQSNRFGVNLEDTLQVARVLLPTLEEGAAGLDEWVIRAARIGTLVPKNARFAARAIQEFLAGQTISLQRVFNIEASLIHEAEAAYDDLGKQIDFILERRGATEEAALESADAWQAVTNELKLAVATGFMPLFELMQPVLRGFSGFLSFLRQTAPAILTVGSALAGVAAVGAPLLIFLGAVISSLRTIRELEIATTLAMGVRAAAGAVAGSAALGAGAGAVGSVIRGAGAGIAGSATGQAIGRSTIKVLDRAATPIGRSIGQSIARSFASSSASSAIGTSIGVSIGTGFGASISAAGIAAAIGGMMGTALVVSASAGLIAAGTAAGIAIATPIVRLFGRISGNERLAEMTGIQMLREALMTVVDILSAGGLLIARELDRLAQSLGKMVSSVGNLIMTLATAILALIDQMPIIFSPAFDKLREFALSLGRSGERLAGFGDDLQRGSFFFDALGDAVFNLRNRISGFLLPAQDKPDFSEQILAFIVDLPDAIRSAVVGGAVPGFSGKSEERQQEIISEAIDFVEQRKAIEDKANQDRLVATEQFEAQRTQVIAQFQKTINREAEDFARQRARQDAELQQSIDRILEDGGKREIELQKELEGSIAEVGKEGATRQLEIADSYYEKLAKLQEQHRLTLLEAASRLDARAVAQENRRFKSQASGLSRDVDKRTAKERTNLQERIAQAQIAHQEHLENAQAADEARIEDMQAAQIERQRIEDEDRAIRLQRQAEDHRAQLTLMRSAFDQQLIDIGIQVGRERNKLLEGHAQRMADLGVHNNAWLAQQDIGQTASLIAWRLFWRDFNNEMNEMIPAPTASSQLLPSTSFSPAVRGFRSGGVVDQTGLFAGHGTQSRPEFMLNADTTSALRSMLGSFDQSGLVAAVAGGGSGGGMSFQEGAFNINIFGAEGQSAGDIGRAVRDELLAVFEEMV